MLPGFNPWYGEIFFLKEKTMAYPNDKNYNPFPKLSPINEPDPSITQIEIICSYPDEPGMFASPPFFAGAYGPLQVYVPSILKIQDILIDLTDLYGANVKLSYITGVIPNYYSDQKSWYFPTQCGQQWIANELETKSFFLNNWELLPGWIGSTYNVGNCLVVLKDLAGKFWPQYQNWQTPSQFGILNYIPGDCDDWEWQNPSDVTKILHIATPNINGSHNIFDCRQFRYGLEVYHYVSTALRPPFIVPQILMMAYLLCLVGAIAWPGNRNE